MAHINLLPWREELRRGAKNCAENRRGNLLR